MRRLGILLALVASLAAAASSLAMPSKPSKATTRSTVNLSGRWVLDVPHSDFGPAAKSTPRWRRDVVVHRGPQLHVRPQVVKIDGDTTHMEYTYRTDGRDVVNQVMGQPVHTTGSWKGGTLELVSKVRVMTSMFLMTERWSLADAGRSLVIERESQSPLGKRHSRMLYHRE
ncbi:MAG: hypothetical protein ABIU54_07885 [Candidatus Eisenbacteria bacterium]